MSLLGNRAIGHSTGLKVLYYLIYTFHFFDRHRVLCIFKVHQSTKVAVIFLIDKIGVLLEHLIASGSCGLLKKMDGCRVVTVLLTLASHFVSTYAV